MIAVCKWCRCSLSFGVMSTCFDSPTGLCEPAEPSPAVCKHETTYVYTEVGEYGYRRNSCIKCHSCGAVVTPTVQTPAVCKCGHVLDLHQKIESEWFCNCDICECDKFEPSPTVSQKSVEAERIIQLERALREIEQKTIDHVAVRIARAALEADKEKEKTN